jgi:hypothetical protein
VGIGYLFGVSFSSSVCCRACLQKRYVYGDFEGRISFFFGVVSDTQVGTTTESVAVGHWLTEILVISFG